MITTLEYIGGYPMIRRYNEPMPECQYADPIPDDCMRHGNAEPHRQTGTQSYTWVASGRGLAVGNAGAQLHKQDQRC